MTHENTDVILKKKKKINNAEQRKKFFFFLIFKKIFKVYITSPMKFHSKNSLKG